MNKLPVSAVAPDVCVAPQLDGVSELEIRSQEAGLQRNSQPVDSILAPYQKARRHQRRSGEDRDRRKRERDIGGDGQRHLLRAGLVEAGQPLPVPVGDAHLAEPPGPAEAGADTRTPAPEHDEE